MKSRKRLKRPRESTWWKITFDHLGEEGIRILDRSKEGTVSAWYASWKPSNGVSSI